VIAGYSGFGSFPQDGFIWTTSDKIQKQLQDYLIAPGVPVPANWQIVNAPAVSADGKIFSGTALNSQGLAEAFVAKLRKLFPLIRET